MSVFLPHITEMKQLGCEAGSPCEEETSVSGAHMNLDFSSFAGSGSLERMQQTGKARTVSCPLLLIKLLQLTLFGWFQEDIIFSL